MFFYKFFFTLNTVFVFFSLEIVFFRFYFTIKNDSENLSWFQIFDKSEI